MFAPTAGIFPVTIHVSSSLPLFVGVRNYLTIEPGSVHVLARTRSKRLTSSAIGFLKFAAYAGETPTLLWVKYLVVVFESQVCD